MGPGWLPLGSVPVRGGCGFSFPGHGGAEPGCSRCPGLGSLSRSPRGHREPSRLHFSPSAASGPSQGWPQPLWPWQSSRIPCRSPLAGDEPTQPAPPHPEPTAFSRGPWIVPRIGDLAAPQGPEPLPSRHVDFGVNPSPAPPTWARQPLSLPMRI